MRVVEVLDEVEDCTQRIRGLTNVLVDAIIRLVSSAQTSRLAEEIGNACLNTRARLLSRVITGIYDDELRPVGMKGSQLNLLVAIASAGPIRRTDIGEYMRLDSSTLTRNLRVMETNGWIEDCNDRSDGRGLPVRITAAGETLLEKAAPAWRIAQRRASRLLGADKKSSLIDIADGLTG